jgi:tetratricopeptide (TPR) repeat protein
MARNLHRFWYIRGFFDEGRALLEQARAARGAKRDLLQHQLLNALGILDMGRRRFGEARAEYEAALAIARELGDRRREAALLTNLGANAERAGDPAEALVHHEQAIEAYRRIGDEGGVAMVQLNAARAHRVAVRLDDARALTEACLPHFRRAGDRHRIAAALQNLGEIDLLEGRPDAARDRLVEALGTRKEMRDAMGMWESLFWIALCSSRMGRRELAATLFGAAERHGGRAIMEWQRAEAVDYAGLRDEPRAVIGGAGFEAEVSRGSAMSLDEAVSLALAS